MKKRILATLMAMLVIGALIGCGNGDEAGAGTENTSAYESVPPVAENSSVETLQPSESLESSETEESEEKETVEEELTEESSEAEAGDESKEATESSQTGSTESELHGIIVIYPAVDKNYRSYYHVGCVDPATGSYKEISKFQYIVQNYDSESYLSAIDCRYTANSQELLSSDCSKLAEKRAFTDTGETHVGWMNSDGTYFDLTEALGEQSQSDFNVKHYQAYGFTPDDRFVYYEEENPDQVFYVYVDDPTVKYEGNPMAEFYYDRSQYEIYGLTSVIDETHYIASCCSDNNLSVYTVSSNWSKPCNHFIESNEKRVNRTGVLSPDGTKIAFWSRLSSAAQYKMYVILFEGGEPQEVNISSSLPEEVRVKDIALVRWQ